MVYWLEVKKARSKQSFEEIIKGLVEKKKAESLNQQAANEQIKRERKERRERQRKEALDKQKEAEGHLTSYINREQFTLLF
jgi:membrane protein involved in colicin uptake